MRKLDQPKCGIEKILKILEAKDPNYLALSGNVTNSVEQVYKTVINNLIQYESEYKKNKDDLVNLKKSCLSHDIEEKILEKYKEYNNNKTLLNCRQMLYKLANGRCPICDTNFVYSQVNLDHILPKSNYKSLAITPINLVPTCNCCNMKKRAKETTKIFSPYFHEYNLTNLLTAKMEKSNEKFDDIQVKVYVKPFSEISSGMGISSKDELYQIEENIKLYGLLDKYSAIASIFADETRKYFQKINLLHIDKFLFSKRQIQDMLAEQDVWDNKWIIEEKAYCNEAFIKHITIEAMKASDTFLCLLMKIIIGNIDVNQLILQRIKEATDSIKEKSKNTHRLNCNALIKKVLRGSDLVAYYVVEYDSNKKLMCNLKDFQGSYQESKDIINFEVNNEWESINYVINTKKIHLGCSTKLLEKFSFSKKNVGIELIVPLLDNDICVGIVYIGMEGEIDEKIKFDTCLIEKFQDVLNEMYANAKQ